MQTSLGVIDTGILILYGCVLIAMPIYVPLTAVFLYIGTMLFVFYSNSNELLSVPELLNEQGEVIGDRVFPCFITMRVPAGFKGLIIAAATSTVDSALNCSATAILWRAFLKTPYGVTTNRP